MKSRMMKNKVLNYPKMVNVSFSDKSRKSTKARCLFESSLVMNFGFSTSNTSNSTIHAGGFCFIKKLKASCLFQHFLVTKSNIV